MTSDDVLFVSGASSTRRASPPEGAVSQHRARSRHPTPTPSSFTLKRPDPLFNGSDRRPRCPPHRVSRKALDEKGEEAFGIEPVGTGALPGPERRPTDGIMLNAFADYWDGPAKTAEVHVTFIADTTARTLAFASGQVDMIEGVRQPGWIPTMQAAVGRHALRRHGAGQLQHAAHQPDHGAARRPARPPGHPLRHQQRDAGRRAMARWSTPMVGIIAPQFAGAVTKDELPPELQYNYDPEKAKALLAEAGHPDGVTIPAFTSQREDYAAIMLMIQEQLRAAGINLDLQIIDHATMHAENRQRQEHDGAQLLELSAGADPAAAQQLSFGSGGQGGRLGAGNYSHYGVAMPGVDDADRRRRRTSPISTSASRSSRRSRRRFSPTCRCSASSP